MASPKKAPTETTDLVVSPRMLATREYVNTTVTTAGLWADTSGLIDDILNAASLEKALKVFDSTPAEEVLDVPLTIENVTFLPSQFDDNMTGVGVFALIRAMDRNTGEMLTISCGAASVAATLLKAQVEGWLPADLKITQGSKTANGFYPLNLEPIGDF